MRMDMTGYSDRLALIDLSPLPFTWFAPRSCVEVRQLQKGHAGWAVSELRGIQLLQEAASFFVPMFGFSWHLVLT